VQRAAEPATTSPAAPATPTVQRQAEPAASGPTPEKPMRTRAPLGAPLTELPPTATPSHPAPATPGP
ncbi:hypothetical protein ACFW90_33160, partial [Streptomyces amritsarensis]